MVGLRKFVVMPAIVAIALAGATGAIAGRKVTHDPPHTDRPGGDYRSFALSAPDQELCVRQCAAEQSCGAYTYVRPGVQGASAMCWLKNRVPPKVTRACCESGTMGYVADPAPQRPTRINPPETLNKQSCAIGLTCANRAHGHWSEEAQICECPAPQ